LNNSVIENITAAFTPPEGFHPLPKVRNTALRACSSRVFSLPFL
jgi:hypothetical protein